MFRLIKVVIASMLILTMAMLAAVLLGHLQPRDSFWPAAFTNPDSSPCDTDCMFGIVPEVTPFEDGLTILQDHPYAYQHLLKDTFHLTQGNNAQDFVINTSDTVFFMALDDKRLIHNLYFGDTPVSCPYTPNASDLEMPSLGDTLSALGNPASVTFSALQWCGQRFFDVFLSYPNKGVSVYFRYNPDDVLKAEDRPHKIYAGNWDFSSGDSVRVPWHGLTSLHQYISALAQRP